MVIHILVNIAQKARRNDTDSPKRNTRQVHPLVALSKRNLTRCNHHGVCGVITLDARDELEILEQRGSGELDGFADVGRVFDTELERHGAADVVFGVGDEFVDEDVVVGGVTDGATNDTDGEGESCDGGDEILRGTVNTSIFDI